MDTIKIGADPEGFVLIGGEYICADGLFPGNKKEPFKVEKGAVQVDGLAVEFNIDAASSEDEFEMNMRTVLAQLDEFAKAVDKDAQIVWTPIVNFSKSVWEKAPENAKILGCDPDYSAITGEVNPNPSDKILHVPVRTASGHIHIGWTSDRDPNQYDHFNDALTIAKGFHALNLEFFSPSTSRERNRLEYYGMNGSFRPKSYGVELRSPSNHWVALEQTRRKMFNLTRNTFRNLTGL